MNEPADQGKNSGSTQKSKKKKKKNKNPNPEAPVAAVQPTKTEIKEEPVATEIEEREENKPLIIS